MGSRCFIVWADTLGWSADRGVPLSDEERERVRRLQGPQARRTRTVGFQLLREVVALATGRPAEAIEIRRTCGRCGAPHGRPTVAGLDVSVSVTHCRAIVGVAVGRGAAIGLDVEHCERFPGAGFAAAMLAVGEQASSPEELCRYWTRKEAAVKATGDGLAAGLTQVVVTAPHQPPALLGYGGRPDLAMTLADVDVPAPYLASLAALTTGPVEVDQQWVAVPGSPLATGPALLSR